MEICTILQAQTDNEPLLKTAERAAFARLVIAIHESGDFREGLAKQVHSRVLPQTFKDFFMMSSHGDALN